MSLIPQTKAAIYPVAVGLALIVGAGAGALLTPNKTPEVCITALDRQEQAVQMLAGPRTADLQNRFTINQALVKSASDECRASAR